MGSATGLVDVDVAVRLLGSVDVLVDGRRLSLVGVKQRAIVAMLVMPREPTPIATFEPGFRVAPMPAVLSSRVTVPGMSATRRSGKF